VSDPFEDLDEEWLRAKPGAKWQRHAPHLAAWVADMDFPPAPAITQALHDVVEAGDFGYPDWPLGASPMPPLFVDRMARRYGWHVDPGECREFADVVQGVRVVVFLATRPGDGIVLHTPAYPPFHGTWRDMNRTLVEVRAHATASGWAFDYDALEHRLRAEPGLARLWILCHPHNPLGHVFERAELERIAQIAADHDLIVVSDEIHAELTYPPDRHVPFASVGPEAAARSVTLTSASKAFNLAGLRWAIAHIGAASVRHALADLPTHLLGAMNRFAVAAASAAWRDGDAWLDDCRAHLDRQRHRLAELLRAELPDVGYHVPRATYLSWLDCRPLGLAAEPVEVFRQAGVELSSGPDFGTAGHGFVRLNFATSSSMLERIVSTMADAVQPDRSQPDRSPR
jgi:cystathionine beta-lyase